MRKLTKNRKQNEVKAIKIKEIVKNMSGLFGANWKMYKERKKQKNVKKNNLLLEKKIKLKIHTHPQKNTTGNKSNKWLRLSLRLQNLKESKSVN